MDIYTWLLLGHLVGAIIGVGGATFIELNLNNALRDGKVSSEEQIILGTTFTAVRVGLILTLFTGFGFLIIYKLSGQTFRLYDGLLWAKLMMFVAIGINTLLLQAHKISLYWGSAISFVSWWAAAIFGFFLSNSVDYSFATLMVAYIALVTLAAVVLHKIREYSKQKSV